jgi:hypothetical protein
MRALQGAAALAALFLIPAVVSACPACGTSTGEQVRAGIFGADFARNLGVSLLPFVVVGAIAKVLTPLLCRQTGGRDRDR